MNVKKETIDVTTIIWTGKNKREISIIFDLHCIDYQIETDYDGSNILYLPCYVEDNSKIELCKKYGVLKIQRISEK